MLESVMSVSLAAQLMISLPGRSCKQFVRPFLVFTHLHLGLGKET